MDQGAPPSKVLERFSWFEPEDSDNESDGEVLEVEELLYKIGGPGWQIPWRTLLEESGHRREDLTEIFIQLGRRPKAIFDSGRSREAIHLADTQSCERSHIDAFINLLGGQQCLSITRSHPYIKSMCIPNTLHRVSFITKGSNNQFSIIGASICIGRCVTGILKKMCPWLLNSRPCKVSQSHPISLAGKSVLFIGKPGSGKTTLIREIAQVLSRPSRDKRSSDQTVVVVDRINELGGDGEVPHRCIGEARWMPCQSPRSLSQVLTGSVDSSNPEVILVDELWSALEVEAACDIAERRVKLIASVHGSTLVDMLNCGARQALLGASTQQGIVRRCSIPAFDIAVELHQKDRWVLHSSVRHAVDAYLRGDVFDAVELRPGLSMSIAGIPGEDGVSYCYSCLQSRRCNLHQSASRPVVGSPSNVFSSLDATIDLRPATRPPKGAPVQPCLRATLEEKGVAPPPGAKVPVGYATDAPLESLVSLSSAGDFSNNAAFPPKKRPPFSTSTLTHTRSIVASR